MRLSEFIKKNKEAILNEWEAFASTQAPAATHMTSTALRDHGEAILDAIVADLRVFQSPEEEIEKSHGLAPQVANAAQTAAETHGLLRAQSGFDIKQVASEFRALRASVLRLWIRDYSPDREHAEDIIRFNEAIDQALAESIEFYDAKVEQARDLFFGMLGHDLRTPLQAIQFTAKYLRKLNVGSEVSDAAARLISSGSRMKRLLSDLVDYNRTRLGLGISIACAPTDLAALFSDEIDALRRANPDVQIEFRFSGPARGNLDGENLQRVLSNLVDNSVKYGTPGEPIRVDLRGDEQQVLFEVRNSGPAIEPAMMAMLFEPLKRGADSPGDSGNHGLGLYISRHIAEAHGGEINGTSEGGEIIFTVRIPRIANEAYTR